MRKWLTKDENERELTDSMLLGTKLKYKLIYKIEWQNDENERENL